MSVGESVQTIHEQISDQLRSEILSGRFRPHEPLREVHLAKRFGLSRGPIRHALQQLVQEGLLVTEANRSARVAPQVSSEVRDLYIPLRAQIETYALRLCFDELDAADFQTWEKQLAKLQLACQERDYPGILDHDLYFHRSILVRANLDEVVPIWTLIVTRTREYYEKVELAVNDVDLVYALHLSLLDVFRTGDKEAAVEALYQHLTVGELTNGCNGVTSEKRKGRHTKARG